MILILLLTAFAVPAAATSVSSTPMGAVMDGGACHDAPPAHHGERDDAVVTHMCIGCAAVGDWLGTSVVRTIPVAAPAPFACVASLVVGDGIAPALRPPRTA